MMYLVIFLIGVIVANCLGYIEKHIIKSYKEISQPKEWASFFVPIFLGLIMMLIYKSFGYSLETVMYSLFTTLLVLLSCFDIKYMLLPTKIIYVGIGVGVLLRMLQAYVTNELYFLWNGLIGAIVGYGLFFILFYGSMWLLKKEGLGFGDVRLMAFIGLFIGIDRLFLMLIISSFLAVLVGSALCVIKRRSEAFPFGPFLCFLF